MWNSNLIFAGLDRHLCGCGGHHRVALAGVDTAIVVVARRHARRPNYSHGHIECTYIDTTTRVHTYTNTYIRQYILRFTPLSPVHAYTHTLACASTFGRPIHTDTHIRTRTKMHTYSYIHSHISHTPTDRTYQQQPQTQRQQQHHQPQKHAAAAAAYAIAAAIYVAALEKPCCTSGNPFDTTKKPTVSFP